MLDQQHGDAAAVADRLDLAAQAIDLLVIEAAGRLVEQQQLRLAGQRARQFDALLRAERQSRRPARRRPRRARIPRSAPSARSRMRRSCRRTIGRASASAKNPPRARQWRADHHVLQHRHRAEQRQVLERARDAVLRDVARGRPTEAGGPRSGSRRDRPGRAATGS